MKNVNLHVKALFRATNEVRKRYTILNLLVCLYVKNCVLYIWYSIEKKITKRRREYFQIY